MSFAGSSLLAVVPEAYSAPVDSDWDQLLRRFEAVIPKGVALRSIAEDVGIKYGYLWQLRARIKTNPGATYRTLIAQYVEAQEAKTRTALDAGSSVVETVTGGVVAAPEPTRGRSIVVSSPLHAALYELLSMLPPAAILQFFSPVEAEVKKLVENHPPPSPQPSSTED
jgi:hypothetical protein